ncbi:MAG: hypothetical protein R3Y67_06055, partial [Eubacteriales bacterium]
MSEESKLKFIKVGIGLCGVIVVIIALGLYSKSLMPAAEEEVQPEAVAGMTGEELELLLDEYRMDDTTGEGVEEEVEEVS